MSTLSVSLWSSSRFACSCKNRLVGVRWLRVVELYLIEEIDRDDNKSCRTAQKVVVTVFSHVPNGVSMQIYL
jgi:hypothetical protein